MSEHERPNNLSRQNSSGDNNTYAMGNRDNNMQGNGIRDTSLPANGMRTGIRLNSESWSSRRDEPRKSTVVALKLDQTHGDNKSSLADKGFSRSTSVSSLYGIIVILFGVVFPMTEAFRDEWLQSHVIAAFMTYLYGMAFLFIVYAMVHEALLKRSIAKKAKIESQINNVNDNFTFSGSMNVIQEDSATDLDEQAQYPKFTIGVSDNEQGRSRLASDSFSSDQSRAPDEVYDYIVTHVIGSGTIASTSYFLKGGIIVFALANILYVALRIEGAITKHIECGEFQIIYPHILHLLFILAQTMLLLKDSKHVFRKFKPRCRFGLAHLGATNLCVWVRFLMVEVIESLHHNAHDDGHADTHDSDNTSCYAEPIMLSAGPYLFPFILEYSLIATVIIAFMFSSISARISTELYRAVSKTLRKKSSFSPNSQVNLRAPDHVHSHHQTQTCDKSHMGLFLGIFVFAGCIVSMVMFFYWNSNDESHRANLCYNISEFVLMVLSLLGVIYGLVIFSKFVFDLNEKNTLDHSLLLISLSFYVIWELFQLISKVNHVMSEGRDLHAIMSIVASLTSVIQCVLQTVFIMDGMQRVVEDKDQQHQKRGRGVVTFLIAGNLITWVFKSFQEKRSFQQEHMDYFGEVAWTIINSVALPMVLFYRFHSSTCLAHMWHHCYEVHDDTVHKQLLE